MRKIFRYELRRAVCNKFFLGLLVVCLFFGWQTLNREVIQGVAHTAPFSSWSFGYYLAQELPLLSVALLFFLWNVFSKEARRVNILTAATPVDAGSYLLVKCGAAVTAWLLLAFGVYTLGTIFLLVLFGPAVSLNDLLLPALISLLPALALVFGIGMMAGRLHPALLLVLAPVALAANLLPLPLEWDLFGATFFSEYPLTLTQLDPAFDLPAAGWIAKAVYLAVGVGFAALAVHLERKTVLKGLQS